MERISTLEIAKEYKRRGYCPIPVYHKDKSPILPEWQKQNLTDTQIEEHFSTPCNIGISLGDKSNNLIDIDIDCEEGLRITQLLPSTCAIFGRTSKRESHFLYTCAIKTKKFHDPIATTNKTLVEIRSTGCQTVMPGSIHKSEEEITWDLNGDPEEISAENLLSAVSNFASASLLARYWPEGSRHEATLALTGALLRSDWRAKDVIDFVEAVVVAANDNEINDRRKAIQDTVKNFDAGNNITGWPTLSNYFHEKLLSKIQEWLDIDVFDNNEENAEADDSDTSELLFNPQEARVDFYLKNDAPAPKVLFNDFPIPYQKSCAQIATGGTGKSFFSLQMGVALASKTPLCGVWPVAIQGKVLVLCAEDDTDEIHRRIKAITQHVQKKLDTGNLTSVIGNDISKAELEERLSENLFVMSLIGRDNLLTKEKNREVKNTKVLNKLINTANEIEDLALIVIDPISRFRGGEENSAEDVTRFVEAIEQIVKKTGATVLASHHASKESQKTDSSTEQHSSRGSSAFTDGVRWQMNMVTMSAYYAKKLKINSDDRKSFVKVSIPKSNYSKPFSEVWLKRLEGGVLEHFHFTSESDLEDEDKLPKVIEKIKEQSDLGNEYSRSKFSKYYGGLKRELGISRDKLDRLVDIGIEKGSLGLRDPERKKRNNRNGVLFVIEEQKNT